MPGMGPLPKGDARRRNQPTIPTTSLPASGRKGLPPDCPYELQAAGLRFWEWAWSRPQAAGWDSGALYAIARRAQLEDDLAALDSFDPLELAEYLDIEETEAVQQLGLFIGRLKGLASGRLSVVQKMNDLDKRLGLDPKAMAELRWKIVADEELKVPAAQLPKNVRRIRPVDPSIVATG